jgi:hypothetical protein
MEETLLAYFPAILAVVLAVALRLLRSRKEVSNQIAALQKKVAALEQRTLELERAQKQQQPPVPDTAIFPEDRELTLRLQVFAQGQRELDRAFDRLNALKAELPFDNTVEEEYVAELNSIVISLEKASGRDLSRWLGMSSQEKQAGVWSHDRDMFRLRILSLLAFCTYQSYHPQLPAISPSRTSQLIH